METLNSIIRREAKNVINTYRRLNNGGSYYPKADVNRLGKQVERLASLLEKVA